jgi:hypothetical protein
LLTPLLTRGGGLRNSKRLEKRAKAEGITLHAALREGRAVIAPLLPAWEQTRLRG